MSQIFRTVKEIKKTLRSFQDEGKSIGFVPTMGYLHKGHLSLIEESVKENDVTVLSIFVNPTQFGPMEDLDLYPRDEKRDVTLAEKSGATIFFIPTVEEMFPNALTTVSVEKLTERLCGISRPTHFDGVTTVVTKLFNIVNPNQAYFGQKDAQQAIVLKKMVEDLNMDVNLKICPIIREDDGVAMSSRNVHLSIEEREEAITLNKSLFKAKELVKKGEIKVSSIYDAIQKQLNQTSGVIDYIEILDLDSLTPIEVIEKSVLIAIAVKFSKARLIDNIIIE